MYNSFIRPSLEYGNILYNNCTETDSDQLESVQRRAARIITGGTISTPSQCLYEELAIETLKARRDRNILLMFHKIIHNKTPLYLQELRPPALHERQNYNLWRSHNYTQPKCRLSKYQKSFFPNSIFLWNSLDEAKKQLAEYDLFKAALEPNLQQNELYFIGERHLNIIMAKIRMNCSELKSHLYRINVIESPNCTCGEAVEDPYHYFFICPQYTAQRAALHAAVANLAPFTLKTILSGCTQLSLQENKEIYNATQTFIKNSKRF